MSETKWKQNVSLFIQILTGKSERYARKVVAQIRKHYDKNKHQLLTIKEFCEYMSLNEDEVKNALIQNENPV